MLGAVTAVIVKGPSHRSANLERMRVGDETWEASSSTSSPGMNCTSLRRRSSAATEIFAAPGRGRGRGGGRLMDVVGWFLLCLGLNLGFVVGLFSGDLLGSRAGRNRARHDFFNNLHNRN